MKPVCEVYTNANGGWTCDGLTPGEDYRVEFSTPQTPGLRSSSVGTDNGGNTQFATPGTCDVNYGVLDPSAICEENPFAVTPCYVQGNPSGGGTAGTSAAIIRFDFDSQGFNEPGLGGSTPSDPAMSDAATSELGSVWGAAHERQAQRTYYSAFVKRHSGMGPLGEGGIYRVDLSSGTPVLEQWLDVNSIGITTGLVGTAATPAARNLERGLSADKEDADDGDPLAYGAVGKIGLGDLDISLDEQRLWLVNLNDQTLNSIEIDSDGDDTTAPTAADVNTFAFPNPCEAGPVRPFGMKVADNGLIYVGVVCESGDAAYLYAFDGTDFTPVEVNGSPAIDLSYPRKDISNSCRDLPEARQWNAWVDTEPPAICSNGGLDVLYAYPTPILADIEIDASGSFIISLMDRTGHQIGATSARLPGPGRNPNGTADLENYNAGGDLLRLCNIDGELFMEGSVGGCPNNSTDPEAGPFGGEFYFQDYFGNAAQPTHGETTVGGIAQHPTRNEIAVTAYDAFNTSLISGGINWFNNETGLARDPGYLIFFGFGTAGFGADGSLGKANGLGDLELLCAPLPPPDR